MSDPATSGGTSRIRRSLRVAIASMDVAGPYHCGGVGAAYQGLATALAGAGHEVTLLYTHHALRGSETHWKSWYSERGVDFVHAPQPVPAPLWYSRRKEASLACYRELAARGPFDVVHFHEWLGLPYYSLLAKHQGLAFGRTLLCVGTHGPMRWSRAGEGRVASNRDDLIVDFMERRSAELADVVVSPSRYMLEWMESDGWLLPENSLVAQNLLDLPFAGPGVRAARGETRAVDEVVFFGRLDRRKGVGLFCDALDRVAGRAPADLKVTFLGSVVMLDEPSDAYVKRRAARWPFDLQIETDADRDAAIAYLRAPGRLAVMPALADNLPCTVHECASASIPFLATDVGGTAELLHVQDHAHALVPPDAGSLAQRLLEILASGQRPAALRIAPEEVRDRWLDWHASLDVPTAAPRTPSLPTVSVCMAHYERPGELEIMLASLRAQSWQGFELVLADDGSTSEEAREKLAALEPEIERHGGAVLRLPNRGPAAARHAAAEHASGEYLLFVDDDDYAEPRAVETFARVAARTGADVLVAAYRRFRGDGAPPAVTGEDEAVVPLGPALAAALIYPELGGTMIFVRREAYFACGGFPRERDVDEDWELLLTLVASGYQLQVIPETLFRYRQKTESRSRADNRFTRDASRIRCFEQMMPKELRDLVSLAYVQLGGAGDADGVRRVERVRAVIEQAARRRAAQARKKA